MVIGLSTSAFTTVHVLISLIGIVSGFGVAIAMLRDRWLVALNQVFLFATIATSATGFLFPSATFGPPHIIGVISLVVLAVAVFALNVRRLSGGWLRVYIVSALFALYLNAFVGVVQAFQKVPGLQTLAPTQAEPPFVIAQLGLLTLFVVVGFRTVKRFRMAGVA
jgi:hypothetical protein